MSSTRAWILLLVGVTFLTGLASGLLLGDTLLPRDAEAVPFAGYQARLGDEFDLGPKRREALRIVMADYHRALEDAKARRAAAMEAELVQLGLTYRGLIRNHVLPEARREEFDRLAAVDGLDRPGR